MESQTTGYRWQRQPNSHPIGKPFLSHCQASNDAAAITHYIYICVAHVHVLYV